MNVSAVALWHFVVASFLLATDQEISAHPSSVHSVKEQFSNPEQHHHYPSEGRGSMESTVKLVMEEGI